MEYNLYLLKDPSVTQGAALSVEQSAAATNIVFQTRSGPLDRFEEQLADALMSAFADGAEELDDVVAALNRSGSVDRENRSWTEKSFREQMRESADLLFAKCAGEQHVSA